MPARMSLRTRRFEITAEGADIAELDKVFDLLKARGIEPWAVKVTGPPGSSAASPAQATSVMDTFTAIGAMVDAPLSGESGLDSFADEDEPLPAATGAVNPSDPTLEVLIWDDRSQVYTLSSKLTPGPGGSDRADEAALVILNGYCAGRGLETVGGTRLVKSLRLTGYNVPRVDHTLKDFEKTGLVLVSGARRGRAYRITGSGKERARKIALDLIAQRNGASGAVAQ